MLEEIVKALSDIRLPLPTTSSRVTILQAMMISRGIENGLEKLGKQIRKGLDDFNNLT